MIVIDPGHGGKDAGTHSPSGLLEKDVVLDIALRLKGLFVRASWPVLLTRNTDEYVRLADRVALANNNKASAFISLHVNAAANNPNAHGFMVFYWYTSTKGLALANKIKNWFYITDVMEPWGNGLVESKPNSWTNFYVIRKTACPAVLVEMGFLTNRGDEMLLRDGCVRDKLALSIFVAVKEGGFGSG